MALANVTYTANGATTVFVVSFGYLQQSHITVTVDTVVTTAYTFNGSGDIEFTVAPANGVVVYIVRDSDITQKLVAFADGSNLTEEDLNNDASQSIFLQQETRDQIATINADNAAVIGRVDTNEATGVTNASGISTNATNIGTNDTDIAANTVSIESNDVDIAANTVSIESNDVDIAANTASISSNDTDIGTNATNIATNVTNIGTNATNIATNVTNIGTNASAIATNVTNIGTNATNIGTNDTDIATNASDITALESTRVSFTGTETLTNKTFDDEIIVKEIATPGNPASGYKKIYPKSDGKLYTLDDSGTETEVGSGGGGGGFDNFYTENFEDLIGAADFTTGNNATFDNGGSFNGIFTNTTSSNISGTKSIIYTQASGSLNDWFKSPAITVQKKQQGQTVGATLYYTYSGDSDDIIFVGYDNTGSVVMTLASNLVKASSGAQRFSVEFPVPSDSTSISWGFQTVVENIGAILNVDDIEISTNPFVFKDTQGENNFSAKISNNGTAAIISQGGLDERGDNAIASVSRSSTGVVAITFTTNFFSTTPSIVLEAAAGQGWSVSFDADTSTGLTTYLVDTSGASLFDRNFNIAIQRQGSDYRQKTEHVIAYNSRNAENSMVRLHTGNGHGSTNTRIRRFSTIEKSIGNSITYTDSATSGAEFLINDPGQYSITYVDGFVGTNTNTGVSVNSTQLTTNINDIAIGDILSYEATSGQQVSVSVIVDLEVGDIVRAHDAGANNTTKAIFIISKIGVGDLMGVPVPRTAYIKDVKASGTSGGAFTSGAWRTRTLNTLSGDTEFISLSSNQFTLQVGKYEIETEALARGTRNHQSRLRNITDSTSDSVSLSQDASNDGAYYSCNPSIIKDTIILTSAKVFELQHRCTTTQAIWGFGLANSFGEVEVYAQVKITKIS